MQERQDAKKRIGKGKTYAGSRRSSLNADDPVPIFSKKTTRTRRCTIDLARPPSSIMNSKKALQKRMKNGSKADSFAEEINNTTPCIEEHDNGIGDTGNDYLGSQDEGKTEIPPCKSSETMMQKRQDAQKRISKGKTCAGSRRSSVSEDHHVPIFSKKTTRTRRCTIDHARPSFSIINSKMAQQKGMKNGSKADSFAKSLHRSIFDRTEKHKESNLDRSAGLTSIGETDKTNTARGQKKHLDRMSSILYGNKDLSSID